MKKWTRFVGLLCVAQAARSQDIRTQTDTFLSWFPADTETALASGQRFDIPDKSQPEGAAGPQMVGLAYLLRPLGDAFGREGFTDFNGRTVMLAVLGARNFSAPPGLGVGGREECGVYWFAESLEDIEIPESMAATRESLPVETYTSELLTPDTLLVCNHAGFREAILQRRETRAVRVALPVDLAEWSQVDRAAPVWGVRHFANIPRDVNNPRREVDLVSDAKARGATLQVNTGYTRVRWVTQSVANPLVEIARAPDFQNAAKTSAISPGVWELNDEVKPSFFGVFVAMALLGFVIYL